MNYHKELQKCSFDTDDFCAYSYKVSSMEPNTEYVIVEARRTQLRKSIVKCLAHPCGSVVSTATIVLTKGIAET